MYWQYYKILHWRKAKAMEALCVDPGALSDEDAKAFIESIDRLSYKYECPIERLKDAFYASLGNTVAWNPVLLKAIKYTKENIEAPKEAKEFGIKEELTGASLQSAWIDNRLLRIAIDEQQTRQIEALVGKTSEQFEDEMDEKLDHPIAPGLAQYDNLENKLIKIAHELVNYLEYYYQPLSDDGQREALIYCCILLIRFRPDHGNEIYLSNLCDRVFLLLSDEIMWKLKMESSAFYNLFNQRTERWSNPDYPSASLYKCFYKSPFRDIAEYDDISESDSNKVEKFDAVLAAMKLQIINKHGDIRTTPDMAFITNQNHLKEYGITPLGVSNLLGSPEPKAKPLIVEKDYSLKLDYEGFKIRIRLSPIETAVYLLFLNHPEGINFKDLADYRDELAGLYKRISRRNTAEGIDETLDRLVDPYNNSINEKNARIKRAIEDEVPEELVHWYIISGEKGGIRKIELPRELLVYR